MRFIVFLLRLSKGGTLLAVLGGILSGALSVLFVARIGLLLRQTTFHRLWFAESALIATAILVLRIFGEYVVTVTGQKIVSRLTEHLSHSILEMPLADFEVAGSSSLLTILTRDIDGLTDAALTIPNLLVAIGVTATAFVYGLIFSPRLTLIATVVIAGGLFTFRCLERAAVRYLALARQEHDVLMKNFEKLIAAAKELRIYQGRKNSFERDLRMSLDRYRRAILACMVRYTLGNSFGQYFFLMLLAFCGSLFQTDIGLKVPRSEVATFIIILLYVRSSVETIVQLQSTIARGLVSFRNIEQSGFEIPVGQQLRPQSNRVVSSTVFDRIDLVNVSYAYGDVAAHPFRLGPISLELRPGEITFIAGDNGSGKTTLLKLILGLYKPQEGDLQVSGKAVRPDQITSYRSHFAAVFSDYYLTDELPVGPNTLDHVAASRYLKRLRLESHVSIEDGRLSSLRLSEGQRKRLSLLHAYVENRPICVFDEWAADQDPEFREYFYRELIPELKAQGKCVVAVTHDQMYFDLADNFVRLKGGQLNSGIEGVSVVHGV